MRKRYVLAAVVGLVVVLGSVGPALAQERPAVEAARDRTLLCERLESKAHALRAEIGRIEAVQGRLEQKIASGELRPRQEARAKLALRLLEARQGALEDLLARVVHAYGERCS